MQNASSQLIYFSKYIHTHKKYDIFFRKSKLTTRFLCFAPHSTYYSPTLSTSKSPFAKQRSIFFGCFFSSTSSSSYFLSHFLFFSVSYSRFLHRAAIVVHKDFLQIFTLGSHCCSRRFLQSIVMEPEPEKTKQEPGDDLEMRVDNLENLVALGAHKIEKRVILHQQHTEKLKMIKTEEAIDCGENQIIIGLEKKISELENRVLEKDLGMEAYRDRMKGLEKEIEELKQHMWIDNQIIGEMKSRLSELVLSNELLRQKYVEANRTVAELNRKLSVCEEEKKMANWIQEDLKRRESENVRCMEDLRRQNLVASRSLEELRHRLSACEEERKMADRIQEEMKRRESENARCVEELKRRVSVCEEEMKMADRVREEMKATELDLRRELSRAEVCVNKMKERSLEAREAAEVNVKRFGNVVPIADDLFKLLSMNVEDLMSVKDKFVSVDFVDGATTAHGGEGGPYPSKALELTISEQSTKSKKRYTPETQITPSSAAGIIDIIDCDDDTNFLVIPKRKRSKRIVGLNKSPIKREGMYGDDMLRAFEEDDELCLHAVCALYRQLVSMSESAECPNGRFYHFEALRGRALAVYLIGGDPEFGLTKSIDEVKQQYPDVVNQCRRLAICYSQYFSAMPSTHEPLSRSLSLPLSYVGACETYCSEGEGEDVEPVSDL